MLKLPFRILPLVCLLLFLSKGQIAAAVPSEHQNIWRVDLRSVAQLTDCSRHFDKLKFYRWNNKCWQPSDAETFFSTHRADVPLIFFLPGFTSTTPQTTQVGLSIVQTFDPDKPCRVVFWDWLSDRGTTGLRRDVQSKIPIIGNTAGYLSLCLQKLEPQSKVCLFGFSFGCRIACHAAEKLRKSGLQPDGQRLHLVLSGAATDQNWFGKGQQHGKTPEIIEKILVTYNPDDWVLRYYPLMYSIGCNPAALGLEGLPMRSIAPEFRDRFENVNVSRYIGDAHQTLPHVRCPAFQSRVNTYFFFE